MVDGQFAYTRLKVIIKLFGWVRLRLTKGNEGITEGWPP